MTLAPHGVFLIQDLRKHGSFLTNAQPPFRSQSRFLIPQNGLRLKLTNFKNFDPTFAITY
jgi:hypothetical protein